MFRTHEYCKSAMKTMMLSSIMLYWHRCPVFPVWLRGTGNLLFEFLSSGLLKRKLQCVSAVGEVLLSTRRLSET